VTRLFDDDGEFRPLIADGLYAERKFVERLMRNVEEATTPTEIASVSGLRFFVHPMMPADCAWLVRDGEVTVVRLVRDS
jgi:hypothetical protein